MTTAMLFMQLTLKGKPIPGDSKLKGFERQIELKSMNWGFAIKSKTAEESATKSTKNWEAKEVRLGKVFDSASTTLFSNMNAVNELHTKSKVQMTKSKLEDKAVISMVQVSARPDGEKAPRVMQVTLAGCRIKSVNSRASEGGNSVSLGEELVLTYQDITIDYFPPVGPGYMRSGATTFKLEDKVD